MKIVNEGDTIGTCKCDGCEQEVAVKVNKNRCVYYYCTAKTGVMLVNKKGVAQEERCFTRMSYGQKASRNIIEQYLAKEHSNVKDQSGQHPAENNYPVDGGHAGAEGNGGSGRENDGGEKPAGQRGGILAAAKHFLTN